VERKKKSAAKKASLVVRKTDFRTNNTSPAAFSEFDTEQTLPKKRQLSPKIILRSPPNIVAKTRKLTKSLGETNNNSHNTSRNIIHDSRNNMKVKILITK